MSKGSKQTLLSRKYRNGQWTHANNTELPQLDKEHIQITTGNISNDKRLNAPSLILRTRQWHWFHHLKKFLIRVKFL